MWAYFLLSTGLLGVRNDAWGIVRQCSYLLCRTSGHTEHQSWWLMNVDFTGNHRLYTVTHPPSSSGSLSASSSHNIALEVCINIKKLELYISC